MTSTTTAVGLPAASPQTPWGREHLEAAVDALVLAAVRYASPSGSLVNPPGRDNLRSSRWCDGLEGYARVGLLVGPRVAGAGGGDPHGFLQRWASGLAAGTDPAHAERWPTTEEQGQAKVEAAAVALLLEQTRPWLWDSLDAGVQERVVAWFSRVVGAWYPDNNWVWFRLVVEAFLTSVTGSVPATADGDAADDAAHDLALHETFVRDGGWYSDGAGRDFDHYGGWALHLYPLLWARQPGAAALAAAAGHDVVVLREQYAARLHAWLSDAALLVGSGAPFSDPGGAVPLLQGRSLIYRFAASAPFWVGALEGCTPLAPGLTRRVGVGTARHFLRPVAESAASSSGGALRPDGTLPMGWHGEFLPMVQPYSGPASPYWAAKGVLGLLLGADHPVWTAPEEPLPVEAGDVGAAFGSPGWLVSGTAADGVVRVLNHGTDHASPGATTPDDPLYARLAYSTATSPDLGPGPAGDPLDSAVVVLDAAGRPSHRTGFHCVEASRRSGDDDGDGDAVVLVGVSQGRVHWHRGEVTDPYSGKPGAEGDLGPGVTLTTASLVRGPWEVRLARVTPTGSATATDMRLRIGGWAVAQGQPLRSAVVPLAGLPERGTTTREGASPLGTTSTTPWAAGPVVAGEVVAALVVLTGDDAVDPDAAALAMTLAVDAAAAAGDGDGDGDGVTVTWPDGRTTRVVLPHDG